MTELRRQLKELALQNQELVLKVQVPNTHTASANELIERELLKGPSESRVVLMMLLVQGWLSSIRLDH